MLPGEFSGVILPFQELFSKRVFAHVKVSVTGAIPAPGKRTVSSVLRIMGLSEEKRFHKYHRVLSLVEWSALAAARVLLLLLPACFLPAGEVIIGIDETLERRWGKMIRQRGIYRDSVRSSGSHFVKSSGLRWISLMLLVPVSWANRIRALPFLSVPAPGERYNQQEGKRHKKITGWARQMLLQVKRWLPERKVIAAGDSAYPVIDLLSALEGSATLSFARDRLGISTMWAVTLPNNKNSIRLLEKIGLTFIRTVDFPGSREEFCLYSN